MTASFTAQRACLFLLLLLHRALAEPTTSGVNECNDSSYEDAVCALATSKQHDSTLILIGWGIVFFMLVLVYFRCSNATGVWKLRKLLYKMLHKDVRFIVGSWLNIAIDIATFLNIVLPNPDLSYLVYPVITIIIIGGIITIATGIADWNLVNLEYETGETPMQRRSYLVRFTKYFGVEKAGRLYEKYKDFHETDANDVELENNKDWKNVFKVVFKVEVQKQVDSLVKMIRRVSREKQFLYLNAWILFFHDIPMFIVTVWPIMNIAPERDIKGWIFRTSLLLGTVGIGTKAATVMDYPKLVTYEDRFKRQLYFLIMSVKAQAYDPDPDNGSLFEFSNSISQKKNGLNKDTDVRENYYNFEGRWHSDSLKMDVEERKIQVYVTDFNGKSHTIDIEDSCLVMGLKEETCQSVGIWEDEKKERLRLRMGNEMLSDIKTIRDSHVKNEAQLRLVALPEKTPDIISADPMIMSYKRSLTVKVERRRREQDEFKTESFVRSERDVAPPSSQASAHIGIVQKGLDEYYKALGKWDVGYGVSNDLKSNLEKDDTLFECKAKVRHETGSRKYYSVRRDPTIDIKIPLPSSDVKALANLSKTCPSLKKNDINDPSWTCRICMTFNGGGEEECLKCGTEKPDFYIGDVWYTLIKSMSPEEANILGDRYFEGGQYERSVLCYETVKDRLPKACENLAYVLRWCLGGDKNRKRALQLIRKATQPLLRKTINFPSTLEDLVLDYVDIAP